MDHLRLSRLSSYFAVELQQCGVPSSEADRIACAAEHAAERAALACQEDDLFMRQYETIGPVELSRALNVSRETLRLRRNRIIANKYPKKFGT